MLSLPVTQDLAFVHSPCGLLSHRCFLHELTGTRKWSEAQGTVSSLEWNPPGTRGWGGHPSHGRACRWAWRMHRTGQWAWSWQSTPLPLGSLFSCIFLFSHFELHNHVIHLKKLLEETAQIQKWESVYFEEFVFLSLSSSSHPHWPFHFINRTGLAEDLCKEGFWGESESPTFCERC